MRTEGRVDGQHLVGSAASDLQNSPPPLTDQLRAVAGAAVTGAIAGAVGGALGKIGGKLLAKVAPKAMKVVGGLFGKGAAEAEETAAADATEAAASRADSEGAGSRAQSHSDEAEPTCHSFTGSTRVLMADGTTKVIDQVRVGDKIANSVPGATGTQVHEVTDVIVTHTDHDFVDVTVRGRLGSPLSRPV